MYRIKAFSLILITFVFLFLIGCSSTKETSKEDISKKELKELFKQEVEANFSELNLWVNLMPNSPNRLQLSGILKVTENFKYDLEFIELRDVLVFQDNKQLYKISPIVQVDPDLSTEISKVFRFSTSTGVSLVPNLDLDKSCNLEFHFYDGNSKYKYLIDNVKIEKTY